MNHEVGRNPFLGCEGISTGPFPYERSKIVEGMHEDMCSEKVHVSDRNDSHQLKLHTAVSVDEKIQNNYMQNGSELCDTVVDDVLVKAPGVNGLNSFVMTNEVDVIVRDVSATEMPDLLHEEVEEVVAISNLPGMILLPSFTRFTIPVKEQRNVNQDNEMVHLVADGNGVLVFGYDKHLEPSEKNFSYKYRKETQPEMMPVSFFNSLNTEHTHFTVQNKVGSCTQVRQSLKVSDDLSKSTHPTEYHMDERGPIACFKESLESKGKELVKLHSFTEVRSLTATDDHKNLSEFPQPKGTDVKVSNDPLWHIRTYNRLLKDARVKDCIDLLESMERKGILDMGKIHRATFLKACKNQNAVKEAFRFIKLIRKPTLSTFNMLLSVCASSKDFDGTLRVMLLVKEAGLKPDCILYTTLISTCGKCGKIDAMFEVFHEMVNAGVVPNVNTYGALIDGCARAGQVAKAFGAYGIMRSKEVQPDRVIFNALITTCGQSGAVDRAFDVLAEMRAEPKPIDPDHVTIGALMKTCTQAGQLDRAREVYKMLHHYNIKGTPYVYTIAVRSCSLTGDLAFALGIYNDMKKNGVIPDEMFLSTLIDVAGHAGKVDAAFDILEESKTKGIKLGNVSYSSLMGACCNAKNWQKALELHEDIKAIKLVPTVSMLNALVTSLCDGGQLLKSVEVLDEMKEAGVHPNEITYSVLTVACEKNGEAELGFTLLSQAKKDGILPNLIMCRCLSGLCMDSVKKAYSLGEPIVSFDSGKPQIDSKWTSHAIMVYRQTIAAGVMPTIETFSQVLGCLQFPRDYSMRDRFVENLGIDFEASRRLNICSLLDGFGEYDTRCFSILEEAVSLRVLPRVSIKDNPIVFDARKLQVHIVEVYILTILKGLKHRLAAGVRLPNITILLPVEKTAVEMDTGRTTVSVAGRVGQAVASLLRRLGLLYLGDESYGKIRINGLTLRRWFKPKLTSSTIDGKPVEMIPMPTRLAKGINDQQRSIRSSNNLSLD